MSASKTCRICGETEYRHDPTCSRFNWWAQSVRKIDIMTIRPQKLAPNWRALIKVVWVMLGILEPRSGDKYPHLIQEPDVESYTIVDGHHRITMLAIMGKRTIKARVVKMYRLRTPP